MAGVTLEQAQAQLDAWLAASIAVAGNQEYTIQTANGSRTLKRADAAEVREQVKYWQGVVARLTSPAAGGRRRVRYVIPS